MKRTALTLTLIFAFMVPMLAGVRVCLVVANPYSPPLPVIAVRSPGSIINVHNVPLIIEVKVFAIGTIVNNNFIREDIKRLNCSIDNQAYKPITLLSQGEITTKIDDPENPFNGDPYILYVGRDSLFGLSDGTHALTIRGETTVLNRTLQKFFYFTLDTTIPKLLILSPENKTYDKSDVTLNFTVDKQVSWTGYSLDNQSKITLDGNTTLTGLSIGSHTLTLYANDTAGNLGASETSFFMVSQQTRPTPTPPNFGPTTSPTSTSEPKSYSTTWILAGMAAIAVVGVCLLVYVRKRKREAELS